MVALRKDVKVGLTIGAIAVSVIGVYAGLSALATGVRPRLPLPMSSKSEERWSWASVPAEKKGRGFAKV